MPWTDTSYDWEIKDNQGTPSTGDVASGKTVQFVGATGALSTVLTDPNSDGNFVMTLTSPNDNDDTLYALAGAADGTTAANYNLVLSADGTAQDTMVFTKGSNITFTRAANSLTIAAANDNTLYDLAGTASVTAGEYNLVLSADSTAQDTMVFKQGSNVTFTRADDLLTINATNTWVANAVTVAGYVAAPAATDANLVWKTDTNGNPAWRVDSTGDNNTYTLTSAAKIITLNDTSTGAAAGTITFVDGSDISISSASNNTITITNDSPDTGIPAVISDGAAIPSLSFAGNVTATMVRTQIGAGTGDGVVESLTTTAIPTSPYMSVATLSAAGVLNIPNVPRYTLDVDQSSQGDNNDPLITLDASSTTDDSIQISGGDLITVTRVGAGEIEIASTAAPNTVFEAAVGTGNPPTGVIGTKGLVPAPPASTWPNTDKYYLTSDETWSIPPGQGIISESVGVADATVNNTPLTAVINSSLRSLTLSSKKYKGGSLVGYVPDGGTNSTYLRGDGTWSSIGSQFQGTWDATAGPGGGGTPNLRYPPSPSPSGNSNGDFYICSVAGNATPNGTNTTPNSWSIGDTIIWSGSSTNGSWTRVPATASGVNSVDTTDGTYINLTPNSASTGSITVTADLSAAATGTSTNTTKFLTEGNKWQVPSYINNTTYSFLAVTTGGSNTNPALRLDPLTGSNNDVILTGSGGTTITRTGNTAITIDSDDTTYTNGTGLLLSATDEFSIDSTVVTLTGTQTLTNKTLTTPVIDQISPSAGLLQVDGAGTVDGGIKLMCYDGTHGQILKSQPHSAGVTNTMLLPAGASSTLVSEATETFQSLTTTGTSGASTLSNAGVLNIPNYTVADTGITSVTLAVAASTGAPLGQGINGRVLTLTSKYYAGTTNVGYVPTGGSATTFLRGDGSWATPSAGSNYL